MTCCAVDMAECQSEECPTAARTELEIQLDDSAQLKGRLLTATATGLPQVLQEPHFN